MTKPQFGFDVAKVRTRDFESCISGTSSSKEAAIDNRSLIRKLHEELVLTNISDKQAFDLASKVSPDLVYDDEFLQLFLNAERADPISAARRLVGHFSHKLEVWGADKLCKNLALSDLTSEDLDIILSGGFEFLPAKDDTEKSVLVINCWRLKHKSRSNLLRAFWYMVNSALKNVPRNSSIVAVAIQYDHYRSLAYTPPRLDDDLSGQLAKCAHSLPVKFSGVYRLCVTASSATTFNLQKDFFTEVIAKENGISLQSNIGTLNECVIWLMERDIPLSVLATVLKEENEQKILQSSQLRGIIPTSGSRQPANAGRSISGADMMGLNDLLQLRATQQYNHHLPAFDHANSVDSLFKLSGLVQGAQLLHRHPTFARNLAAYGGGIVQQGNDQLASMAVGNLYTSILPSSRSVLGHADGNQAAAMTGSAVYPPEAAQGTGVVSEASSTADMLLDQQHHQGRGQSSPAARSRIVTDHPPICLHIESDSLVMSEYQCLIRQQLEAFAATADDVQFHISRSMGKSIRVGRVGIRCRHCADLPQYARVKGAVFYPKDLNSLYQVGQNMVQNHLLAFCKRLPDQTKAKMEKLRHERRRGRGGREHWASSAKLFEIDEDGDHGLYFFSRSSD